MYASIQTFRTLLILLVLVSGTSFDSAAQNRLRVVDNTTGEVLDAYQILVSGPVSPPDYSLLKASGEIRFTPDSTCVFTVTKNGYEPFHIRGDQLALTGFTVNLTPTSLVFSETIISANKFEENKNDIPRQVAVLTAQQIAQLNTQNTADLMQSTGDVFVQKSQMGGGSPVLRGFEANKVLLVVDGVRMNNAIYRGGHLQNILRIDQHMLARAEVVFGAGSVIYGSDAFGGVFHFYTRNPTLGSNDKPAYRLNALTTFSSVNNFASTHADFNIGFRKIGMLTGITYSTTGDLMQGANRNAEMGNLGYRDSIQTRSNNTDTVVAQSNRLLQSPSGYSQIDITQKVSYAPDNRVLHLLNFQYSRSSEVPRYDRLTEINPATGTFRSAEWYYGPELRIMTAYQLTVKSASTWFDALQASAAYQHIEESRHNRNFGNNIRSHRMEKVDVYSVNLDAEKQVGRNEIRYGGELSYNAVKSEAYGAHIVTGATSPLPTRYPDGGSEMLYTGIYINHAFEINKHLVLSEGLRFSSVRLASGFIEKSFFPYLPDQYKQQNNALNGQVGLVYRSDNQWITSLSLASGFRAPNVDDLAKTFESAGGERVLIPNEDLNPEYVYNWEVRLSKLVKDRINTGGGLWYSYVDGLIAAGPATVNGHDSILFNGTTTQVVSNRNMNSAYLYGASAFLNADLYTHFSITNTVSYTYGRMNTDNAEVPLDHIAPLFGRSAIVYRVSRSRTELYLLYNGKKSMREYNPYGEDNQLYATSNGMPAWYILTVQTSYSIPLKQVNFRIQAGIENLMDRNYRTFASGISAPGRNLFVTLRVTL